MSDNMLDILKNFDAADKGEAPKASSADAGDMKTILESFNAVSEAPMPVPAPAAMPQEPQGQPVSMNVSLNASGKDHVDDLLTLMQNAGLSGAGQVGPADTKLDVDMDGDNQPDIALLPKDEDIETDEGYANSPDGSPDEEEYKDTEYMTKDLSGGLNREKKMYAKAQDGDNAMAVETIKDMLYRALAEKMDPVGQEDDDINNDGEEDSSDEYLKKRRAAIAKATADKKKK